MSKLYNQNITKIGLEKNNKKTIDLTKKYIFLEHNDRYLRQCYYNLQEKYDRRNYYRRGMELN